MTTEITTRDFVAKEGVGVQIGEKGHKVWVCIDGQCVLRVKAPKVELEDRRDFTAKTHWHKRLVESIQSATGCTYDEAMKALGKVCSDIEDIHVAAYNQGFEAAEEYMTTRRNT